MILRRKSAAHYYNFHILVACYARKTFHNNIIVVTDLNIHTLIQNTTLSNIHKNTTFVMMMMMMTMHATNYVF